MNPEISRTFPKNNAHKCAQHKTKKQQIGIKNSGLLLFCYQNIKRHGVKLWLCTDFVDCPVKQIPLGRADSRTVQSLPHTEYFVGNIRLGGLMKKWRSVRSA